MSEITNDENNFAGYEYKCVTVKRGKGAAFRLKTSASSMNIIYKLLDLHKYIKKGR